MEKFNVPDEYPVGIDLAAALKNPGCDNDLVLREGDRLVVPQYTGTVKINGAVMYANTVAYEKGKRASYYIDQAGGFASDAIKSKSYIIYMNGKMSIAETMSLGTSMSSIAAMIATIANLNK